MTSRVLLYVEDEEGDVFFMRYAFDQVNSSVALHVVSTGPEAIGYLSGAGAFADRTAHPMPTTVLLDVKLPGCSGFDVLKWLRDQPQLRHLPVIMFSSSVRPEDLQRARELGANDYIEKPGSGLDFTEVARELHRSWMNDSLSFPSDKKEEKSQSAL